MTETEVLRLIRQIREEAVSVGQYGKGYNDALALIQEMIEDDAWEKGEDIDEDRE